MSMYINAYYSVLSRQMPLSDEHGYFSKPLGSWILKKPLSIHRQRIRPVLSPRIYE